jgi:hypothetical protein
LLNTGVPTVGITLTVVLLVLGPLQPAAIAVMVVVPVHEAEYVTAPEEALIVFPPVILALSNEKVTLVADDAFATYVTIPAPWHLLERTGANIGNPQ